MLSFLVSFGVGVQAAGAALVLLGVVVYGAWAILK